MCAIALPAEITAAVMLIRFWDHEVRSFLLVFFLTDLATAVQQRPNLHRGLDCRCLQCQYTGVEVRIRRRVLIPSDINFSKSVFLVIVSSTGNDTYKTTVLSAGRS